MKVKTPLSNLKVGANLDLLTKKKEDNIRS